MGRPWLVGALLALAGLMGGCGGEDGGDSAPRVEGLLTGVSTRSSTDRSAIAYAGEGRFMVAEAASEGFFFDGEYTISDGVLSGTARIYGTSLGLAHARYFTETATLGGTATEAGWQVSITGANSTTTFALARHADDTRNSSLSAVQGTWVYDPAGSNTSTLTVAADGTTASVNDSHCQSAGSLATIDPRPRSATRRAATARTPSRAATRA